MPAKVWELPSNFGFLDQIFLTWVSVDVESVEYQWWDWDQLRTMLWSRSRLPWSQSAPPVSTGGNSLSASTCQSEAFKCRDFSSEIFRTRSSTLQLFTHFSSHHSVNLYSFLSQRFLRFVPEDVVFTLKTHFLYLL